MLPVATLLALHGIGHARAASTPVTRATPKGIARPRPTPRPSATAAHVASTAAAPTVARYRVRDGSMIDLGWTGIAHRQPWPSEQRIELALDCRSATSCTVGGGVAGAIFGAPIPLSAGGVPACVVSRLRAPLAGSVEPEAGCGELRLALTSTVYTGREVAEPCPRCVGDGTANDGRKDGRCDAGPSAGEACDANAASALFGATSNDCLPPPASIVGTLAIDLAPLTTDGVRLAAERPCGFHRPGLADHCACADQLVLGRIRMFHRSSIGAVAWAAALLATPCAAQVVDFGKYPDFKGQWVRTGNPNNWIALAGPPPLTAEYRKIWDDITADLKAGGPGNWPSTFCIPAGMPAMMSFYDPMEMIVMPEITYILISHNDDSYRRIYTDGRDWPADPELTFAGYSIGKWIDEDGDGKYDVLEVETRFLRGPRAYEVTGIPFHEDNQTVIKERFYLDKADRNTLYDEITVIDHAMTRPYTKVQKAVRKQNPRPVWLLETCPLDNVWVKIGNEAYVVNSADGMLMPARKDQPPPDLRYFKQPQK